MFYQNTIPGKHDCEVELLRHLNAILPNYTPITKYYREFIEAARNA
jgi:hypothetical protein